MKREAYPIVIVPLPEEDGPGYFAYAPDLKGCISHGETQAEAMESISDAIDEWIEEAKASGRDVPKPHAGVAKAVEDRTNLLKKIHEQGTTIAVFTKQIDEMRSRLSTLTELIEAEQQHNPWPATMLSAVSKGRKKAKSGHEVH